jgi:hypothetical protein
VDTFKRTKHRTNRRGTDDPRPEWRFQQPGESRKEYLKRYQREYHKQEWYPDHKKERIQETKDRRAELQEWYTKYKATLHCENCGEWRPECLPIILKADERNRTSNSRFTKTVLCH